MNSTERRPDISRPKYPVFQLHDSDDVAGIAVATVARAEAGGLTLSEAEREDAIGELIAEAIYMSGIRDGRYAYTPGATVDDGGPPRGIFDPSKSRYFGLWLRDKLPLRLVDWLRREKGDSRNKTRPELVPLEPVHVENAIDDDGFVEQIAEAAGVADDLSRLSERSKKIVETIVVRLAHGERHDEVAHDLGISRRAMTRQLQDVRNEILGLSVGMDDETYALVPPSTDDVLEHLHGQEEDPS